jgi:hypothetical protein
LHITYIDSNCTTSSWTIFHFHPILHFLNIYCCALFAYFAQLTPLHQVSFWISNLTEFVRVPDDHLPGEVSILWHFFLTLLRLPEVHSVVGPTRFLAWLWTHAERLRDSRIDIAIFGVCLLIVRTFPSIATPAFQECHLAEGAIIVLARLHYLRGIELLLHYLGEVILKFPELNAAM